jgi:hypothetical protein
MMTMTKVFLLFDDARHHTPAPSLSLFSGGKGESGSDFKQSNGKSQTRLTGNHQSGRRVHYLPFLSAYNSNRLRRQRILREVELVNVNHGHRMQMLTVSETETTRQ